MCVCVFYERISRLCGCVFFFKNGERMLKSCNLRVSSQFLNVLTSSLISPCKSTLTCKKSVTKMCVKKKYLAAHRCLVSCWFVNKLRNIGINTMSPTTESAQFKIQYFDKNSPLSHGHSRLHVRRKIVTQ